MPLRETVELDVRNAQNQLDQLETQFDQLRTPITVPVELTGEQAIADLRRQVAAAEQDDIDISVNTFGLDSADAAFADLKGQIDQTGDELAEAQRRADALGAELQQTGQLGTSAFAGIRAAVGPLVATLAAGIGIREVVQQFNQAIDAASALTESMNAVEVVFGEGAAAIQAFGKDSAANVGLAASQVNELVTPIGALLQNFGLEGREAADAALELTTRAADLASVFNTEVDDALVAIGSALRGEQEPIRRFGVNLNAAALDAKALELGLVGVGEEVTQAIRGQAAYAEVLEQTAFAAGDFAATADSAANKQRILSAELETARATIGEALLPAFESVLDIMPGVIEAVENLAPAFGAAADTAADFIAGIFAILETLGAIPAPVKIATAALLGLLGAARLVYAHPVIAGLGLVAAGITAIGNNARAEKEQVDELRAAIETLLAVGDAEPLIGEIQTDIRELIGDSDELRRGFEKLGVPLATLADFVIGDPAAIAEVEAAIARVNEQFERGNQLDPFAIGDVRAANEFADALRSQANRRAEVAEETRKQRDAERDLADAGEFADKKLQQQIVTQVELNRATDGFADSLGRVFDQSIAENVLEEAFGDIPTVVTNFADLQRELDNTGQSLNSFLTDSPDDTGIIGIFDDIETRALETLATLQEVAPQLTETLLGAFGDAPVDEETGKIEDDIQGFFDFLDEKAGERAELEFDLAIVASEAPNLAQFLADQGLAATDIAAAFAANLEEAAKAEALIDGAEGMAAEVAEQFAGFLETLTPEELANVAVFGAENFVSNPIRAQLQESASEMAQVLSDALAAETISPAMTLDLSNVQITGAINTGQIPVGTGEFGDTPGTVNVTINNPTTQDLDTSATQAAQTVGAVASSLPAIR